MELLDGSGEGEIVGIQGWRGYRGSVATDGIEPVTGDGLVEFYLPTLHYFSEFPFRMRSAELEGGGGLYIVDTDAGVDTAQTHRVARTAEVQDGEVRDDEA